MNTEFKVQLFEKEKNILLMQDKACYEQDIIDLIDLLRRTDPLQLETIAALDAIVPPQMATTVRAVAHELGLSIQPTYNRLTRLKELSLATWDHGRDASVRPTPEGRMVAATLRRFSPDSEK